jgi:NADH-quinone oxidoreductase subunit A
MLFELAYILVFFIFSLVLSLVILGASYVISYQNYDNEKISSYECGFNPFQNSYIPFDIRFYLVAILFIIFDLEITFLFPWCISLIDINISGFIAMSIFLFVLTIGFVYEWKKGALEWS